LALVSLILGSGLRISEALSLARFAAKNWNLAMGRPIQRRITFSPGPIAMAVRRRK
jgi:hypothetical protein